MSNIKPTFKTTAPIMPMCYAYTTPEIARHNGWTKIGYTEQDVDKRLAQQSHTIDAITQKEWAHPACFLNPDGTIDRWFKDYDFHRYLTRNDVPRMSKQNEWFQISGPESERMFNEFCENGGFIHSDGEVVEYTLREEQQQAVADTTAFFDKYPDDTPPFLWNAKPRFGKTLTTYALCKKINAKNVLIVTNRPAIANSWYEDYRKFLGRESGYFFISNVDGIKNEKLVVQYDDYSNTVRKNPDNEYKCIEFVSLQDLKGGLDFGGKYHKLSEVARIKWDLLVIDEAHEGVDTMKTDKAFQYIHRRYTLHLSGTPFKALATNDAFNSDAVYSWTYADEQAKKLHWYDIAEHAELENPYLNLPQLQLFTYKMSDLVVAKVNEGIDIDGRVRDYAFDLNEFFATNKKGEFIHDRDVDAFLNALTTYDKFPFSTPELQEELKHTFWLLHRVSSAKALAKKLAEHDVFKDYHVIIAAGDGKLDDIDDLDEDQQAELDAASDKAYNRVKEAIASHDKTITLSVGQLTTGVTIPEWTAVFMLSSMKSPALYMQAAFRAQNPCVFEINGQQYRKETAYVFDFDPARTLDIFEKVANDLYADTAGGKGDEYIRKKHIVELLNFFPVFGEDPDGSMVELDAGSVMSIPRQIHAQEVVNQGFMCTYLFKDIHILIRDKAARDQAEKAGEATGMNYDNSQAKDYEYDENGNPVESREEAETKTDAQFGEKVYRGTAKHTYEVVQRKPLTDYEKYKGSVVADISKDIQSKVFSSGVANNASKSVKNNVIRHINRTISKVLEDVHGDMTIRQNKLRFEYDTLMNEAPTSADVQRLRDKRDALIHDQEEQFKERVAAIMDDAFVRDVMVDCIKMIDEDNMSKEATADKEALKKHLKGFARCIPAILMAYGDEHTTFETFDQIVPKEVFKECTRNMNTGQCISLEDFQLLKPYFDTVVFNDAVEEFMKRKHDLRNYFEDGQTKDIFDYIPPQQTNQIFTPKKVVKHMCDLLEKENPGCFDNPEATFIDLYMKSGLYIAEIVKRLYRSPKMKEAFPDDYDRLFHIFEHQVYGLAPTEIIYQIAKRFIFGFTEDGDMYLQDHIVQYDSLPAAQGGILEQELDKLFG